MNVEPQPNIFPIPLNNVHVEPFSPSTLSTHIITHNQTLNLSPSSQHAYNLHLEPFAPPIGVNLPFEG
jgi:hypothetical protein